MVAADVHKDYRVWKLWQCKTEDVDMASAVSPHRLQKTEEDTGEKWVTITLTREQNITVTFL